MTNFFLSSTFHDMQSERDAIVHRVLPALREYANQHGQDIAITDLRWGIDTTEMDSDTGTAKILSVCMKELDHCYPHMIVLLGDRYGSVPPLHTVSRFYQENPEVAVSLEGLAGKSVTEMEIAYGLFHSRDKSANVTICIRNPLPYHRMTPEIRAGYVSTDEEEIRRLAQLKAELIRAFPDSVVCYDAQWSAEEGKVVGLEAFSELLTQRLLEQFKAACETLPQTPEARQMVADRTFAAMQAAAFAGRERALKDLEQFVRHDTEPVCLLSGPSGIGKSSLLAKFASDAQTDANVLLFFCGNGQHLNSGADLMRHLSWRLCELLGVDAEPYQDITAPQKWRKEMTRLMNQAAQKKPLILILDALDVLEQDSALKNMDFLPEFSDLSPKVKIILSAADTSLIGGIHRATEQLRTLRLGAIDGRDIQEMISLRMRNDHKEIPKSTQQALLSTAAYKSPLYASLVLFRCSMLSGYDYAEIRRQSAPNDNGARSLYGYLEGEIARLPQTEGDMAIYLADMAQKELSYPAGGLLLKMLCLFPEGIRCGDLLGILGEMGLDTNLLDIKVFLRYIGVLVRRTQDDLVFFSHGLIERELTEYYQSGLSLVTEAAFRYFQSVSDLDPVKLSVYLKLCYRMNQPCAAADFLASVYSNSESGESDCAETVMGALHSVYTAEEPEKVIDFILELLNAAADSEDSLHLVCSAFLFTLDTFFGENVLQRHKTAIMRRIYDLAVEYLYPAKTRNLQYLRVLYVCCEQNGIRADNYEDQCRFYEEFNRYCLEFISSIEEDYPNRIDIIRDLSLSYEKLAALYVRRNWRQAVALYDEALLLAKMPCRDERRPDFLLHQYHTGQIARAECILGEARLKDRLGWLANSPVAALLPDTEERLTAALVYLLERQDRPNSHHYISRCYQELADLARLRKDTDGVREHTEAMLRHARQAYRENGSVILLDWVRNAEFRLGYDDLGLGAEQRREHLERALSLSLEVQKAAYSETVEQIIHNCAEAVLNLYWQEMSVISASTKTPDREKTSELCIACLGSLSPALPQLLRDADGTLLDKLKDVVLWTIRMTEYQRKVAVLCLELRDPGNAAAAAQKAHDLFDLLKPHIQRRQWLEEMLDLCNLLRICLHNYRVYQIRRNRTGDMTPQLDAQSKLIALMLGYEAEFGCDETSETYRQILRDMIAGEICLSDGWLRFAAEYLGDAGRRECFWDYLERIDYRIPNWRTVYFDAMRHPGFQTRRGERAAVGAYLCRHLNETRVQKLLFFSVLFENVAMEWAYQGLDYETAQRIIDNGYDRYLELSTLYIVRRHDRQNYLRLMHEQKFLCLSNHRKTIRQRQLHHVIDRFFLDEADGLCCKILQTRKLVPADDPRHHAPRSVFKFARRDS